MDNKDANAINNLGNLYIRQKQYQLALSILNGGILNLLSSTSPSSTSPCHPEFMLIMLRCHRFIALTKLNFIDEASKDLSAIVRALENT